MQVENKNFGVKKIISSILFFILVLVIAFLWQSKSPSPEPVISDTIIEENQAAQTQFLTIDFVFDTNDIISLQYSYPETQNLWQITTNIASTNNWDFVWEDYGDMGVLITQIKDKANGQDNKYWQYEVDGQTPMLSVDNFVPQVENNIKWLFQKSEF